MNTKAPALCKHYYQNLIRGIKHRSSPFTLLLSPISSALNNPIHFLRSCSPSGSCRAEKLKAPPAAKPFRREEIYFNVKVSHLAARHFWTRRGSPLGDYFNSRALTLKLAVG